MIQKQGTLVGWSYMAEKYFSELGKKKEKASHSKYFHQSWLWRRVAGLTPGKPDHRTFVIREDMTRKLSLSTHSIKN